MHARSTTIQARPDAIDDGVAHVRDVVMPAILDMSGCVGLSMLADRQSGRCIVTTAWEDETAMRASAHAAGRLRDEAAKIFGGQPQVDEWEIAMLHRDHRASAGACARVTWLRLDPDQLDRVTDVFSEAVLPAVSELDGFCSASLLLDRSTSRCVGSVAYDSMDAMRRSTQRADEIRASVVRDLGAERLDIGEFELAIAHLRVPEMA
ncbi:antibiotic biosynthesis monooxygenase [Prauserella oleivorans]|uniref:Antibiotic biosynthesis monooxygenase n=1 Tax=Prauserella oleivorans TaxID=1478153 RepID=A0ABW5WA07_9PSEU